MLQNVTYIHLAIFFKQDHLVSQDVKVNQEEMQLGLRESLAPQDFQVSMDFKA